MSIMNLLGGVDAEVVVDAKRFVLVFATVFTASTVTFTGCHHNSVGVAGCFLYRRVVKKL